MQDWIIDWIWIPAASGVVTSVALQGLAQLVHYDTGLVTSQALIVGLVAAPIANAVSFWLQKWSDS